MSSTHRTQRSLERPEEFSMTSRLFQECFYPGDLKYFGSSFISNQINYLHYDTCLAVSR